MEKVGRKGITEEIEGSERRIGEIWMDKNKRWMDNKELERYEWIRTRDGWIRKNWREKDQR